MNSDDEPGSIREDEENLPQLCHVLTDEKTGTKVYLIGTAHISEESCNDVRSIIGRVQPDAVVLDWYWYDETVERSGVEIMDSQAAGDEASKLSDCPVIFGDRHIDITVRRAWACVPWYLKLGFFLLEFFFGIFPVEWFPETYEAYKEVIIHESDTYLTYQLQTTAQNYENGTIVGVVGAAHLEGILDKWGTVTEEDMERVSE